VGGTKSGSEVSDITVLTVYTCDMERIKKVAGVSMFHTALALSF
jgi:hypothetical protein